MQRFYCLPLLSIAFPTPWQPGTARASPAGDTHTHTHTHMHTHMHTHTHTHAHTHTHTRTHTARSATHTRVDCKHGFTLQLIHAELLLLPPPLPCQELLVRALWGSRCSMHGAPTRHARAVTAGLIHPQRTSCTSFDTIPPASPTAWRVVTAATLYSAPPPLPFP